MKRALSLYCLLALSAYSCQNNGSDQRDFTVSGSLSAVSITSLAKPAAARSALQKAGPKTITHVMAINPETSNPTRFISAVDSTGAFSLGIESGRPYVLVFIAKNSGLTGPDMIAGMFKLAANDLDTLTPTAAGSTDLGQVTVDGTTQQGSPAPTFNIGTFLGDLGITAAEAGFIGSIDDLSLRAANPDVDGNGEIDALEGLSFNQDWHIRSNTTVGASGPAATFADITGKYLDSSGSAVATVAFNLGSAYAVYPDSFSSTICPLNSGVSTALTTGCAFRITANAVDVTSSWPNGSFSGGSFGDTMHQWGPDYTLTAASAQDLPGSGGTAVTMEYTMPNGKTLTFSHVKTRSKSTLAQNGAIIPFLQINTSNNTTAGTITSIDYRWKKLQGSVWSDATANEVALLVNESGGYASFYTAKSPGAAVGVGFTIPKSSASGTISWTTGSIGAFGTPAPDIAALTPNSFCSSAVSYDDKIGLRIFAGGLAANTTVTPCP
ncbi:MAG: hypothetical protein A2638_04000 [Nitrospirae bacterium RIFCSPHIGHO2_01_FULL_66_17]|nr:MAG: hypothetical protein A2638_04000 [Nitrospirae bacterium RIFCSPHIGHO2_01_FULL_66_17]